VALEYTPLIYRTTVDTDAFELIAHTGSAAGTVTGAWIDEAGAMLVQTQAGVGVIHDQDLSEVLQRLVDATGEPLDDEMLETWLNDHRNQDQSRAWLQLPRRSLPVFRIDSASVPLRFKFDPNPHPSPGEPEC
jgi:hypothetical protein